MADDLEAFQASECRKWNLCKYAWNRTVVTHCLHNSGVFADKDIIRYNHLDYWNKPAGMYMNQ